MDYSQMDLSQNPFEVHYVGGELVARSRLTKRSRQRMFARAEGSEAVTTEHVAATRAPTARNTSLSLSLSFSLSLCPPPSSSGGAKAVTEETRLYW